MSYVEDCMQLPSFFLHPDVISWTSRDPEAKDKMNPFAEQEAWEEHQIGNVIYLKETSPSFSTISFTFAYGLWYFLQQQTDMEQNYVLVSGKSKLQFGSKDRKRSSDDYQ
jgi:pre-mRNA-splicing factor ATP-dependent RNA helicase DHX16